MPTNIRTITAGESRDDVVTGVNTDGDELPNNLDPDDDNDGLVDGLDNLTRPSDNMTCRVLEDCDGDGLSDRLEYDIERQLMDEGLSYTNSTSGLSCRVLRDCDGDGVDDKEEIVLDAAGGIDVEDSSYNNTILCVVSADCDGDGVEDGADAFDRDPEESVDADGDGFGDTNADKCLRIVTTAAGNEDNDNDGFGAGCDSNDEFADVVFNVVPGDGNVTIHWRNPDPNATVLAPADRPDNLGVGSVNISLVSSTDSKNATLESEDLSANVDFNLNASSFYTVTDLTDGDVYNLTLTLSYNNSAVYNRTALVPNIAVGPDHDGDTRANFVDADDDNDGVNDVDADGTSLDACPQGSIGFPAEDKMAAKGDFDGDGCKNDEDPDDDGDGVEDAVDLARLDPTKTKDPDEDGIDSLVDNCPLTFNRDQADEDGDGFGTVCDLDDNAVSRLSVVPGEDKLTVFWKNPTGDATVRNVSISLRNITTVGDIPDIPLLTSAADLTSGSLDSGSYEVSPLDAGTYNLTVAFNDGPIFLPNENGLVVVGANFDVDHLADSKDDDDDNDGVPDETDREPNTPPGAPDADKDGTQDSADDQPTLDDTQVDADYDGIDDVEKDNCVADGSESLATRRAQYNADQANADGDAQGDKCDDDDGNYGSGILSRPQITAYYPDVKDEEGNPVLNVNVTYANITLMWRNPELVYLPSKPGSAVNLTSVTIEWVGKSPDIGLQRGEALLEGPDSFNHQPTEENSYIIEEFENTETGEMEFLRNGTTYNITLTGVYEDAAGKKIKVVLATRPETTPAAPVTLFFIAVGDEGGATVSWTNPLLEGKQSIKSITLIWDRLDNRTVEGDIVNISSDDANDLLEDLNLETGAASSNLTIDSGVDIELTDFRVNGRVPKDQDALLGSEANISYRVGGLDSETPYQFRLEVVFAAGGPAAIRGDRVSTRIWTGPNHDRPDLAAAHPFEVLGRPDFDLASYAADLVDQFDPDDDNDGFADEVDACEHSAVIGINVMGNRNLDVDQDGCHDAADNDEDVPDVTGVAATSPSDNTVVLTWTNPIDDDVSLAQYVANFSITYEDAAGVTQNVNIPNSGEEAPQRHVLEDLTGGSDATPIDYTFTISANYTSSARDGAGGARIEMVRVTAAIPNLLGIRVDRLEQDLGVSLPADAIPANPGATLERLDITFRDGTADDPVYRQLESPSGGFYVFPRAGASDTLKGAYQHKLIINATYAVDGATGTKITTSRPYTPVAASAGIAPDHPALLTTPLPAGISGLKAKREIGQAVLTWTPPATGRIHVYVTSGQVVLEPDRLVSSTSLPQFPVNLTAGTNNHTDGYEDGDADRHYIVLAVDTLRDLGEVPVTGVDIFEEYIVSNNYRFSGQATDGVGITAATSSANAVELAWTNPAEGTIGEIRVQYMTELDALVEVKNLTSADVSLDNNAEVMYSVDRLIGGRNYTFVVTASALVDGVTRDLTSAMRNATAGYPVTPTPKVVVVDDAAASVDVTWDAPDNAPAPRRLGDNTLANDLTSSVIQLRRGSEANYLEDDGKNIDFTTSSMLIDYKDSDLTGGVAWVARAKVVYRTADESSSAETPAFIPKLPVPTITEVTSGENSLTVEFTHPPRAEAEPIDGVVVYKEVLITASSGVAGASSQTMTVAPAVSDMATLSLPQLTGGIPYRVTLTPMYTTGGTPGTPVIPDNVLSSPSSSGTPLLPRLSGFGVLANATTPLTVDLSWTAQDIPGSANDLEKVMIRYGTDLDVRAAYVNATVLAVAGMTVHSLNLDYTGIGAAPGEFLSYAVVPIYAMTRDLTERQAGGGSDELAFEIFDGLSVPIYPFIVSDTEQVDENGTLHFSLNLPGEVENLALSFWVNETSSDEALMATLDKNNNEINVSIADLFPDKTTENGTFNFEIAVSYAAGGQPRYAAPSLTGVEVDRDSDNDGVLIGIEKPDQCPNDPGNSLATDPDRDGCANDAPAVSYIFMENNTGNVGVRWDNPGKDDDEKAAAIEALYGKITGINVTICRAAMVVATCHTKLNLPANTGRTEFDDAVDGALYNYVEVTLDYADTGYVSNKQNITEGFWAGFGDLDTAYNIDSVTVPKPGSYADLRENGVRINWNAPSVASNFIGIEQPLVYNIRVERQDGVEVVSLDVTDMDGFQTTASIGPAEGVGLAAHAQYTFKEGQSYTIMVNATYPNGQTVTKDVTLEAEYGKVPTPDKTAIRYISDSDEIQFQWDQTNERTISDTSGTELMVDYGALREVTLRLCQNEGLTDCKGIVLLAQNDMRLVSAGTIRINLGAADGVERNVRYESADIEVDYERGLSSNATVTTIEHRNSDMTNYPGVYLNPDVAAPEIIIPSEGLMHNGSHLTVTWNAVDVMVLEPLGESLNGYEVNLTAGENTLIRPMSAVTTSLTNFNILVSALSPSGTAITEDIVVTVTAAYSTGQNSSSDSAIIAYTAPPPTMLVDPNLAPHDIDAVFTPTANSDDGEVLVKWSSPAAARSSVVSRYEIALSIGDVLAKEEMVLASALEYPTSLNDVGTATVSVQVTAVYADEARAEADPITATVEWVLMNERYAPSMLEAVHNGTHVTISWNRPSGADDFTMTGHGLIGYGVDLSKMDETPIESILNEMILAEPMNSLMALTLNLSNYFVADLPDEELLFNVSAIYSDGQMETSMGTVTYEPPPVMEPPMVFDDEKLINIGTPADLRNMLDLAENSLMTGCGGQQCDGFELINDITFAEGAVWTPVAWGTTNVPSPFGASNHLQFNGNGFTIKIAEIKSETTQAPALPIFNVLQDEAARANLEHAAGLFSILTNADVYNLHLDIGTVNGTARLGALAAMAYRANIVAVSADVERIYFHGSSTTVDRQGIAIGGLVGYLGKSDRGGYVTNLLASYANVTTIQGYGKIGGLVGQVRGGSRNGPEYSVIASSYARIGNMTDLDERVSIRDRFYGTVVGLMDTGSDLNRIYNSYGIITNLRVSLEFELDQRSELPKALVGHVTGGVQTAETSLINSYGNISSSFDRSVVTIAGNGNQTLDALRQGNNATASGPYNGWNPGTTMEIENGVNIEDCSTLLGVFDVTDEPIWNFGTALELPAINCVARTPEEQRQ